MDNNKEWFACKYEPLLCDLLEERVVKSLDTLVKHQVEVELTRARKVLEICFYS
jgi:5-methylcytosine-specific restriction endonuclease McrBC regulatory subunit McrC